MELERTRRVLTVTAAELAECEAHLPTATFLDVQFVMDGVAGFLLIWGLLRLVWDATHRRPDLFPLDR